jgi:hypothetical protein
VLLHSTAVVFGQATKRPSKCVKRPRKSRLAVGYSFGCYGTISGVKLLRLQCGVCADPCSGVVIVKRFPLMGLLVFPAGRLSYSYAV